MSLFALRCFKLCQNEASIREWKIYTINRSKYSAKNECNTVITTPRRHKHSWSGANRPSDVAVTVNINTEFNLMAVNPIIEYFSRNLLLEYCQGLKSCTVYTLPPFCVETLPGRSNKSLPCLLLPMHAQEIIPTFIMSNIYIEIWLSNALTLARLCSYEMFPFR